jgi:hypothetical protein
MKVFIGFVVICFFASSFLTRRSLQFNRWLLLGMASVIAIVYFFFNQI